MTDAKNSEVTIDELIQTIKNEVAKQQKSSMLSQQPALRGAVISPTKLSNIEALLNAATAKSQVRTDFPHKFNRFPWNLSQPFKQIVLKAYGFLLKEQRAVNFSLIQALRESLILNRQLAGLAESLQLQASENREHLHRVEARLNSTEVMSAFLDQLSHTEIRISDTEGRLCEIESLQDRLATTESHLKDSDDRLATTESYLKDSDDRLATTESYLKDSDDRLSALSAQLSAFENLHLKNDTYLKNDLAQQKRLTALFLEEAQRRLPEPLNSEQLRTLINEQQHSLDAFYVAFEDQFRGSREDISNRLKVYLPLLEVAKIGTPDFPILDVGCGRGEWLELLRDSGYTARGIDVNRVMLEQCSSRGLDVLESDLILHLQSLPSDSLGAVTGFHVIEHISFEALIKLFDEVVRVLKPQGLVIFETPNPKNILVGSHTFYLDPSHRNPLPSSMIKFMAEARGLHNVTIMDLHPSPEALRFTGSGLAERLNEFFYSAQDYAVIGYRNL